MDKLKRKQDNIEVPKILLAEKSFEFHVPLPLEECVTRLDENIDTGLLSSMRLNISYLTDETYKFDLKWGGSNSLYATGYITGDGTTTSLIKGTVGRAPEAIFVIFMLVMAGLFFGGMALINGWKWSAIIVPIIFGGLFYAVIWYGWKLSRDHLIAKIHNAVDSARA